MKKIFTIILGTLAVISLLLWIFGMISGAIIPLFGGIKAAKMGETCFILSGFGELGCLVLDATYRFQNRQHKLRPFQGFSGGKRYGNKKYD